MEKAQTIPTYTIAKAIDFPCSFHKKGPRLLEVSKEYFPQPMPNRSAENLHAHNHTEITYVAKGRLTFSYNGKNYELQAGDILFLSPGVMHFESWSNEFQHYSLAIAPLALHFQQTQFIMRSTDYTPSFIFYITTLVDKVLKQEENYRVFVRHLFSCFMQELFSFDKKYQENEQKTIISAPSNNVALIVKNHIDQNYLQDLPIKNLCAITYCSERHLIHCFKASFGITPLQYLLRLRIQTAARLLLTRENTVAQIGFSSGFHNTLTFIYHFKKLLHTTPQAFREKYKKDIEKGMKAVDFFIRATENRQ